MAPAVSKFDTLPFNCYEIGHTWTTSCNQACQDVGMACFKEALKIYTTYYLMSMAATQRFPKNLEDAWKTVKSILRSSVFLSVNAFGFMFFLCNLRKLKGNFNFFTLAFIPSVLGCYLAILVEKPQRRPMLALYVANVATETLYRILRSRGLVRDIKYFDIFLFCSSMATLLYFMKKGKRRNDFVDSLISKIFGSEEFTQKVNESVPGPSHRGLGESIQGTQTERSRIPANDSYRKRLFAFFLWMYKCVRKMTSQLGRMVGSVSEGLSHDLCPHTDACFDYWFKGFTSRFLSGFAIQAAIQSVGFLRSLQKRRLAQKGRVIGNSLLYPCLKSGLGLSGMCLAFRLFSCSFRWLQGRDGPIQGACSGLLATALGALLLRPPGTVALYVFFKAAERVISESHERNNWRVLNFLNRIYGGGWCILYALSTATLFHTGVIEPQNLKPSYLHFLSRVTGNKIFEINRHLMTPYYPHSNLLIKDFWPNLNEKFLSEHMKTLLRLSESAGRENEAMRKIVLKFVSLATTV